MPDLPRIPRRFSRIDILLEVFCFIVLLESWTFAVYTFNHSPSLVPIFYKFTDNNIGDKNAIWLFPILATLAYLFISWLNAFPHKFKYKETITKINAGRIYRRAMRRLTYVKLILVLIFGIGVVLFAYFASQEQREGMSLITLFSFILLVLPSIYLLYLVYAKRKK